MAITTPQLRAPLYKDVESLLHPGFLTHVVTVAGQKIHLRSLCDSDLFLLRSRSHEASNLEWRAWMVATGIWMIGGDILLGQPEAPPRLFRMLLSSPRHLINALFSQMTGLFHRAQRAFHASTIFCLEDASRHLWISTGRDRGLDVQGVPGVERLGRNPVQQFWVAFNTMEDQILQQDLQWEGHKLVAATNAPKFIERLRQQEIGTRRQKEDERDRRLDEFFFSRAGIDPSKVMGVSNTGGPLKSTQELAEEMRRWVVGEMDEHDLVIHQYRESVRQQQREAQRRREEFQQLLATTREELSDAATPLVAISAEHLDKLLAGRASPAGVSYIHIPTQRERLLREATPGNLQVVDGRLVDPHAQGDLDNRTLQSLISGRHPSFGGGD